MHVRKRLRDEAKAALATAVTAVSGRVGGERAYSRSSAQLPAIEVSTPEHSYGRIADTVFGHMISLEVTILATGHSDMEDTLDGIAETVEATMLGAVQSAPFDASIMDIASAFEAADGAVSQTARLTIAFSVRVFAPEDDPQDVS